MNSSKNRSIKQFLAEQGISPKQERAGYGMYLSPFRNENTPSFKVDYNQNLWYDFGTGEGGSIVDLVMRLKQCSFHEASNSLLAGNFNSLSFHRNKSAQHTQSTLHISSLVPLQDARLIDYLQAKRAINIDIAREYCREVHYTTGGKPFFAIGFQSDAGGWELRNEYFKGSTSPKGITTLNNGSPTCLLFEGFIDMLSYLTLKNTTRPNLDVVVLNSVINLSKVSEFLQRHQTIHCFLDNDEAGRKAYTEIEQLGVETIDQSAFYRHYKDLNEYLLSLKLDLKIAESTSRQVPKLESEVPKSTPKPPQRRMK